ncbi:hypothetical protein YC2023_085152 [Brassica napus]
MRMWLRSTPQVCKFSADLHEDLYGPISTSTIRVVPFHTHTKDKHDTNSRGRKWPFPGLNMGLRMTIQVHLCCGFTFTSGLSFLSYNRDRCCSYYQAITYLTILNHLNNNSSPHLVVCHASVLEN